jgi:hypothetical protein
MPISVSPSSIVLRTGEQQDFTFSNRVSADLFIDALTGTGKYTYSKPSANVVRVTRIGKNTIQLRGSESPVYNSTTATETIGGTQGQFTLRSDGRYEATSSSSSGQGVGLVGNYLNAINSEVTFQYPNISANSTTLGFASYGGIGVHNHNVNASLVRVVRKATTVEIYQNGSLVNTISIPGGLENNPNLYASFGFNPLTIGTFTSRPEYTGSNARYSEAIATINDSPRINYALAENGTTITLSGSGGSASLLNNGIRHVNNSYSGNVVQSSTQNVSFSATLNFSSARDIGELRSYGLRSSINYDQNPTAGETSGFAIRNYTWEYSTNNGSSWTNAINNTSNNNTVEKIDFVNLTGVTNLRFTVVTSSDGWGYLAELEAWDITPDSVPPADMTLTSATVINTGQINVAYNTPTDDIAVTKIKFQRSTNSGFTGTPDEFEITSGLTSPWSNNTGLQPTSTSTYYYRAKAGDAAGNYSTNWSNSVSTTITINPPGDVTGLIVTAHPSGQVSLDWDNATAGSYSLTDYTVYYNTVNNHSGESSINVGSTTSQLTINGLTDCNLYYFWVKAKDNKNIYSSNYSNVVSTRPGVPLVVNFNTNTSENYGDGYGAQDISSNGCGTKVRVWKIDDVITIPSNGNYTNPVFNGLIAGDHTLKLEVTDDWGSGNITKNIFVGQITGASVTENPTENYTTNVVSPTWTIVSGAGTINASGVFTKPTTGSGTTVIKATNSGDSTKYATKSINWTQDATPPSDATLITANRVSNGLSISFTNGKDVF